MLSSGEKQWTETRERKVKTRNFSKNCSSWKTHAIFSLGLLHGSSRKSSPNSSSLSSLFSFSSPFSSEMLSEDDVNISGTGKIDGLRLPVCGENKAIKKSD